MRATLRWNGKNALQMASNVGERRIINAGLFLQNQIKRAINRGGRVRKGGKVRVIHSKPGEPPRKQTGNLQNSIIMTVGRSLFGQFSVKVGVGPMAADYGPVLEDPSKLNRPFILPTLKKSLARIGAILNGG